ncbi:MAG: radical SAM protein [Promethearchaeota archaeon]|nr:MAG: radical SAM protein [Candidatus Lokiarchaeota archaeon]
MRNEKISESKESNYFIKERGIPKGCQQCLKGQKSVLFLNGICQKPDHCSWYCPISEERRGKDISFINEIKIEKKSDILKELKKSGSKGMSITGGEPLIGKNIKKTIEYIHLVKTQFNEKFHIHLYTNGINFNHTIAEDLSKAGLDEIRFHPSKEKWSNIKIAMNKGMVVGAEVPIIPKANYLKELYEFIFYLDNIGADFINLNEFEYCFPNSQSLKKRGFTLKKGTLASVNNSREKALELIQKTSSKTRLKIHFCSIRAKDYYQLKNRYFNRAQNIKLPYEEITEEGLLLYGQIEGDELELKLLFDDLLYESQIPSEFLVFEKDSIKIPYYIMIDDKFLDFLNQYEVKGFILEVLPFRKKPYRQIAEKTPINVFKNEIEGNES